MALFACAVLSDLCLYLTDLACMHVPLSPSLPPPWQVTNVREASKWMSYTYLYTRMTQVTRRWPQLVAQAACLASARHGPSRSALCLFPLCCALHCVALHRIALLGRSWPLRHTHTTPPSCPCPPCVQNPLAYGIPWEEVASDPPLEGHRRKLITEAARELERSKMARFDERSGNLYVTGKWD